MKIPFLSSGSPMMPQIPSGSGSPMMPNTSGSAVQINSPSELRFKERADYEKGFETYFEEVVKPVLKTLEPERLEALKKMETNTSRAKKLFWPIIIVSLVIAVLMTNAKVFITGIGIAFVMKMILSIPTGSEYALHLKRKIVPLIVKFFGDFEYQEKQELEENKLTEAGIFQYFNKSSSEDCMSGTYRDTVFSFAEVNLINHNGNKNHSYCVFSGMLLSLELNNHCLGKTILKRESDKGVLNWLTGKSAGLRNYKLGNEQFEKVFEAYSSDENEARRLLTPDLMDRLLKLNDLYPNGAVRCSFQGNRLLIATSHNGAFETGRMFENYSAKKLVLDIEEYHKYLAQMHEILQMIDTVVPKPLG